MTISCVCNMHIHVFYQKNQDLTRRPERARGGREGGSEGGREVGMKVMREGGRKEKWEGGRDRGQE